jgi:hypothetical protein
MAELDRALTLAFTLRANPGAYALLLGSGVSKAAVPTGWDVLVDLVRKIAAVSGVTDEDPIAWYETTKGGPPGYDGVLEELTSTSEERVGLLRPYFELTSEDEEEAGKKHPTAAHRAIARLMKAGLVRIVLTTNFDRLLERALEEIGVAPTVLSNPSAVAGAVPLHQQRACIVKLHGDYLDPSFRNVAEELVSYSAEVDSLIDQVFDEYGLVVAGWSSTWDHALRSAIERCPSRRYGTYWIEPFPLSEPADRLARLRHAEVVVETADEFFVQLADNVETLAEMGRIHPTSIAIGVASAKRYLEEDNRIRLHDLLASELAKAKADVGTWPYQGDADQVRSIAARIDAALEMVTALVAVCARWGDATTDKYWFSTALEWCALPVEGGIIAFLDLRLYPATLVMYAAGAAMVAAGRLRDLEAFLRRRVVVPQSGLRSSIASELVALRTLSGIVPANATRDVASDHVFERVSSQLVEYLVMTTTAAEDVFELFEYLLFLVAVDDHTLASQSGSYPRLSPGRIRNDGGFFAPVARPAQVLERESVAGRHPWIDAGLFDGDEARLSAAIGTFNGYFEQLRGRFAAMRVAAPGT